MKINNQLKMNKMMKICLMKKINKTMRILNKRNLRISVSNANVVNRKKNLKIKKLC